MFKLTFKGSIQRLGHNSPGYNSCGPNEWQCKKTGSCISLDSLCNRDYDCIEDENGEDFDRSDEEFCGRMFDGY